jgi:hypothetical protein
MDVDKLFDHVDWQPVNQNIQAKPNELYATHQGTLRVYDFTFRVYQLNDGTRVIDAQDIEKFISIGNRHFN